MEKSQELGSLKQTGFTVSLWKWLNIHTHRRLVILLILLEVTVISAAIIKTVHPKFSFSHLVVTNNTGQRTSLIRSLLDTRTPSSILQETSISTSTEVTSQTTEQTSTSVTTLTTPTEQNSTDVTTLTTTTEQTSTDVITLTTTTPTPCTAEFKSQHLMRLGSTGRLGNALFRLCTLIAAADDYCYTAVVPPAGSIVSSTFHVHNLVKMEYNVSHFTRVVGERGHSIFDGPVLSSREQQFDVNWTIAGRRQSYKYFQNKTDLVRSSFVFKDKIMTDVWRYFVDNSLQSRTRVSIHVRRRDFVNSTSGFHASHPEYIKRALAYFKDFRDVAFIVTCQEMKWCKDNLQYPNMYFSPFKDTERDFCIATQCDHNIITTGTFSWFGAWLNETGIVIYDKLYPEPNSWLAKGHKKEDYYPERWIGL